jgi:hypothetical protein
MCPLCASDKINNFRRLRLQMTTWRVTKDLYKYLKLIADTETFIQSMKNDNTWKKTKSYVKLFSE